MRVTQRTQTLLDLFHMKTPNDRRVYCINFPELGGIPCDLDCNKLEINAKYLNTVLAKILQDYPLPPVYTYQYWNPETQEHRGIYLNQHKLMYNLLSFLEGKVVVDIEDEPNPSYVVVTGATAGFIGELDPQIRDKIRRTNIITYDLFERSNTDNIEHLYNRFQAVKI